MAAKGQAMQAGKDRRVRYRRVFYIPGYDPFPPRRYRELYRSEGREQARLSGYALAVRGLGGADYGWEAILSEGSEESRAVIEVLLWDDIVRGSMSGSIGATYLQALRTAWVYLSGGAFLRFRYGSTRFRYRARRRPARLPRPWNWPPAVVTAMS